MSAGTATVASRALRVPGTASLGGGVAAGAGVALGSGGAAGTNVVGVPGVLVPALGLGAGAAGGQGRRGSVDTRRAGVEAKASHRSEGGVGVGSAALVASRLRVPEEESEALGTAGVPAWDFTRVEAEAEALAQAQVHAEVQALGHSEAPVVGEVAGAPSPPPGSGSGGAAEGGGDAKGVRAWLQADRAGLSDTEETGLDGGGGDGFGDGGDGGGSGGGGGGGEFGEWQGEGPLGGRSPFLVAGVVAVVAGLVASLVAMVRRTREKAEDGMWDSSSEEGESDGFSPEGRRGSVPGLSRDKARLDRITKDALMGAVVPDYDGWTPVTAHRAFGMPDPEAPLFKEPPTGHLFESTPKSRREDDGGAVVCGCFPMLFGGGKSKKAATTGGKGTGNKRVVDSVRGEKEIRKEMQDRKRSPVVIDAVIDGTLKRNSPGEPVELRF